MSMWKWTRWMWNRKLLSRKVTFNSSHTSDPETLIYSHVMNPPGSEDHFGHDKIFSGADGWNIKSPRFSCSFQLGDRMFIVGGEGSYGYDSYELLFAPPQWIAKVGSKKIFYFYNVKRDELFCETFSWKNFQIYQSDSKMVCAMLTVLPTQ